MLNNKPKILGITLARGGSKSVPKKNIKLIAQKPLIAYSIEEALKSKNITRYIVSTDCEEIKDVSQFYGADVPFIRPKEFSTDKASSAAAIKHALQFVESQDGFKYDYIVEIMCTNPLKTVDDIDGCINKLIETQADSVIAVHKLDDHHPIRIKKIINDRIVDFCLKETLEARRQDLKPDAYIRSGSIYAFNRSEIINHCRRYGSVNSRPFILPSERAINIDNKIDFMIAEKMIQNKIL